MGTRSYFTLAGDSPADSNFMSPPCCVVFFFCFQPRDGNFKITHDILSSHCFSFVVGFRGRQVQSLTKCLDEFAFTRL